MFLVVATVPLWGMRILSIGFGSLIEAGILLLLALCLPMAAITPRLAAVACAGLLGMVGYAGFDLSSVVFSVVITIAVLAAQGLFWYAALLAGCMLISGFYSADQRKFDYDVPSLILSSLLIGGAFVAGFLVHLYHTRWREERERARERKFELARQLHDTVASDLTALIVKLEGMAIMVPECADELRICAQSARQAMFDTRQLLQSLTDRKQLAIIEMINLENVLETTTARLAAQGFNVQSRFEVSRLEAPEPIVEVLRQCLQEVVANVIKYADLASVVELRVCVESWRLLVSVANTPANETRCEYSEGRGLGNIATTLARVSGHLQLKQSPGCWMVTLSVPVF